jgi:hypothetical protein
MGGLLRVRQAWLQEELERVWKKTLAKIKRAHPRRKLKVCYEADPCGFVIARVWLNRMTCRQAAGTLLSRLLGLSVPAKT